ncbi:hypothetical protein LIER_13289 [Lithospermum erythrorhizon]|uniref:Uncharacterized protein n=1 Tax=Lithospermum erythrorhizon TaxID=34254 RepID=A0AAV3PV21_LITER
MAHILSALGRCNVSYYPHGMLITHIMLKWNIIRMTLGEKGLIPKALGKTDISKMQLKLVYRVLQFKLTKDGSKRQHQSGSGVGTSSGVEGGPSSGVEDGISGVAEGGVESVPGMFDDLPQWLGEYNLDDIPIGTGGAPRSSVEA